MKKRMMISFFSILLFLVLMAGIIYLTQYKPYAETYSLQSGWTITYAGEEYEDVDLMEISPEDISEYGLRANTTLYMKITLPETEDLEFPTLMIHAKHCSYRVLLDGQVIDTYDVDKFMDGEFIGSYMHFITLPSDYQGKELVIELGISQNNAFKSFSDYPVLGEHADLELSLLHRNIMALASGLFLITFGVVFLAISLIFSMRMEGTLEQVFASLLCIDFGLYMLCYFSVASFLFRGEIVTVMEYTTLYLMAPISILIMYSIVKPKIKWAESLIISICMVPLVFILLHLTDLVYLNRTLNAYYAITLIEVFTVTIYTIFYLVTKQLSMMQSMQLVGLTGMMWLMIIGELTYIMVHYAVIPDNVVMHNIFSLAAFYYVYMHMVTYMTYVTESFARQREYRSLSHMAYADALTDLPNRSKCEKIMEDIERTDEDYCIISFDLNNLKQINDSYGHNVGDNYIKDFAEILNNNFGEHGSCGRFGGDEFVAILSGVTDDMVKKLLKNMQVEIDYHNLRTEVMPLSVSYGYAFHGELPNSPYRMIYMLADQRMYAKKHEFHKQ